MFKKLFGKKNESQPSEPIFPGEAFSIFKLDLKDGLAFATINTAYNQYPNKKYFPWCAQIVIDIHDKNNNGHPTDYEAGILNELEDRITQFLRRTQTVHPIGRVTRNGERDIIYYIDQPKLDQKETKDFFDQINAVRNLNFSLEHDPQWEFVGGFIK
jgi:hypothetical protein